VLGTATTINTSSLVVNDSMLVLGVGNYTSDLLDIGFTSHYNDGTNAHAGFIRDASTKDWYVFKGYTPEHSANNNIDINHASFALANVNADYVKANLITNGVNIYTHTSAAFNAANTNATNITIIQGVNTTQNTNISAVDTYATSAFGKANSANVLAQAAFDAANSASAAAAAESIDQTARNTANTASNNITIIQGVDVGQNTRMTIIEGVDVWQNTQINSASSLAQAAFNKANTLSSVLTSTVDTFTGNGSSTNFTLTVTPQNINYTTAVIGGVTQPKSAYSVVGTTLTFTSAPANNIIVEVTTIGTSDTTLYTVNNILSPFLLMGA
jgi:hypothetical protein